MIAVGLHNNMYCIVINGQAEVLDELGFTKIIDAMIALIEAEIFVEPPEPEVVKH